MYNAYRNLRSLLQVKRCQPLLALLFMPVTVFAQTGTVTYAHTQRFDLELPEEMAQFKEFMPPSVTANYTMAFSGEKALSRFLDVEEPDQPELDPSTILSSDIGATLAAAIGAEMDNVVVKMDVSSGMKSKETHWYVDYAEGIYLDRRELLSREFLVQGTLPEIAWKLTGEEAQFLERRVMKATAVVDSTNLEAWFAPEIPVALGPNHYSGLPGLILMLSLDDGKELYEATALILDDGEVDVSPPEDGREVTEEEYQRLVAEKSEEMQQRMRSFQGEIIRMNR